MLTLAGFLVSAAMPAAKEVLDLCVVQLLKHEVAEAFVAPRLVLVADDARGDEDAGGRVFIRKAMDSGGDFFAQRGIEDFVEPIEEHDARIRLQP